MTATSGVDALTVVLARHDIENLITRYCMACDDRDIATLVGLFTEDAYFGAFDRSRGATGRRAIHDYYRGRFEVMGPSYHWSHDRLIQLDSADSARGTILAHCEFAAEGRTFVGALRYHDRYLRQDGQWRFQQRGYESFYIMPAEDYATGLGRSQRVWAYGTWYDADLPEKQPGWAGWRDVGFKDPAL